MANPSEKLSYLSGYYRFIVNRRSCSSHLSALERIKDELQPLYERSSTVGYQESDPDQHVVCELAEDLRDAIIEYQVGPDLPIIPQDILLRWCTVCSTEGDIRPEPQVNRESLAALSGCVSNIDRLLQEAG
jgi:hypothetical protein